MGRILEKDEKLTVEETIQLMEVINEVRQILNENEDGYVPEPPC